MLKVSRRLDLDKHTAWFGHGVYQIGDEKARSWIAVGRSVILSVVSQ